MKKWYDKLKNHGTLLWWLTIFIPVFITLTLLIWRYCVVSCKTWWFTDYVGIMSLGVGIGGFGITIWTLYRTGIIKDEILRVRKEHLFIQRISDHEKTIEDAKDTFKKKRMLLLKSEPQAKQKIFYELREAGIRCEATCKSLLEKTPDSLQEPIQDLFNACISFKILDMSDKDYHEKVNEMFDKLYTALSRIQEFEKDRKERIR
jgi:hypothetical protein